MFGIFLELLRINQPNIYVIDLKSCLQSSLIDVFGVWTVFSQLIHFFYGLGEKTLFFPGTLDSIFNWMILCEALRKITKFVNKNNILVERFVYMDVDGQKTTDLQE